MIAEVIAEEIQTWVNSVGAAYQGTAASGVEPHAILNDALKMTRDGRLLTEVLVDPGGFVVGYGVGPAHVSTMRAAAEGALPPGYLRAVDAVIITAPDPATVNGIRRGVISVYDNAIPVDHKFGGARRRTREPGRRRRDRVAIWNAGR